jgi:PAS domain S-box-containing protein
MRTSEIPWESGMTDEHSQQVEWAGSAVVEDEVAVLRARLAAAERRAEAAERRARQLDGVFGALADGIIVYDRHGNMLFTNPANVAILGSPEQWEVYFAQPLADRLKVLEMRNLAGHPLPRAQWPHLRVLRGEVLVGATAVELSAIGLDGQVRQLSVTGAPLRDEQGEIAGAVLIHRDVSERRQLERETRRQATMLERAHDAIFMWELSGPIVYWNRGAELLYGFTREEAIGCVSHDLLHTRLPQPPAEFETALATAGEWTGELIHTTRDSREVVVLSRHQVLVEPDGRRYVLETARDITERGRLERRTHEALDALLKMAETLMQAPEEDSAQSGAEDGAEDGAETEQDLQAVARRMAEVACSVLGCQRVSISAIEPETLRVQTVAFVGFTPEQERQWMEDQRRRQARFGESGDPEVMARFMAGEVLALDLTQPPYNERPNPFGITTSLFAPMRIGERIAGILTMDYGGPPHAFTPQEIALAGAVGQLAAFVIERERLLRERAEAQARVLALEDANRRMDEFLGIASHELRTPLTTVKANLQLARRRLERALGEAARLGGSPGTPGAHLEAVRSLLDRAATSSDRQERLVNDLLDVSRIRSGKLELRVEPCDLTAIVREAVEEQRLGHPDRRITLAAPKRQVDAVADADRIAQVITNLLTNALKYSDGTQPVDVRLSVEPGEGDASAERGRVARVSVADQGPGISPEEQAHVWDMFHRVPGIEVRSGSGVGLGLGLHISKTLVERHGGQVGIESTPGEGATFWFTLPLATGDA